MKKWLKGILTVCMIMFCFGMTAAGQEVKLGKSRLVIPDKNITADTKNYQVEIGALAPNGVEDAATVLTKVNFTIKHNAALESEDGGQLPYKVTQLKDNPMPDNYPFEWDANGNNITFLKGDTLRALNSKFALSVIMDPNKMASVKPGIYEDDILFQATVTYEGGGTDQHTYITHLKIEVNLPKCEMSVPKDKELTFGDPGVQIIGDAAAVKDSFVNIPKPEIMAYRILTEDLKNGSSVLPAVYSVKDSRSDQRQNWTSGSSVSLNAVLNIGVQIKDEDWKKAKPGTYSAVMTVEASRQNAPEEMFAPEKVKISVTVPCEVTLDVKEDGKVTADSKEYKGNASLQAPLGKVISYKILPDDGYVIAAAKYNGKDMLAELKDSVYTAPALTDKAAFSVEFKEKPAEQKPAEQKPTEQPAETAKGIMPAAALDTLAKAAPASDKDLKDSTYVLLQARASRVRKRYIELRWNKVDGAVKYIVYGNRCGKKGYKAIKAIKKTGFIHKKLAYGTYYKYFIAAVDKNNQVLAVSKTIHAITTRGKYANVKAVTVEKNKIRLKAGKKYWIKATVVPNAKRLEIQTHRALKYESSDPSIAVVGKKGRIIAKKKGVCFVYVYAQNGVYASIRVTVK